jgi:hypothetical protein
MDNGTSSISTTVNCGNRTHAAPGGLSIEECKKIINIIVTYYRLQSNYNLSFKTELKYDYEIPLELKEIILSQRNKGNFLNNQIYAIYLTFYYGNAIISRSVAMEDIEDKNFSDRKLAAVSIDDLFDYKMLVVAYNNLVQDILVTGIQKLISNQEQ